MRAGELRHRVTLQRRVETQLQGGTIEVTYADAAQVWASVQPLSGREFFAAQQVQADVTTRIRIRYRPGVTETMRVLHTVDHGQSPPTIDIYDIEAVLHDERSGRVELQLLCRKRGADGVRSGNAP